MECLHYDILVFDTLSTLGLLNECNDLIDGVGPSTSSSNAAVNLCSQDEFKYEYALKERIQRLLNRLKTVDKRNGSLDDKVEEGSNVEFTDSCSCSTQDHSNNTITRPPTVATEDEIRTLCQTAHVAIADAVSFGVCVWYIQVGFSQILYSHCNFRCHRTRQQNSITLNNSYPSLTLSCMVMSQWPKILTLLLTPPLQNFKSNCLIIWMVAYVNIEVGLCFARSSWKFSHMHSPTPTRYSGNMNHKLGILMSRLSNLQQ